MRIETHSFAFNVDPGTDLAGWDPANPAKPRFWERMAAGKWEPDMLERFCRSLRRPGLVIDVGAWIGPYSLLAAAAGRDVLAIEPDPDAFCKLLRNRALLPHPDRVTPIAGALWPRRELVRLHALALGDSETSVAGVRLRKEKTVSPADFFYAAPIGFDELERIVADRAVAVMKVDIEGAEYENLRDILDFAARRRCDLAIAFHPGNLIGLEVDRDGALRLLHAFAAEPAAGRRIDAKCAAGWIDGRAAFDPQRPNALANLSAISVNWST